MTKKLLPILSALLILTTLVSCVNNSGTLETVETTFESISETISEIITDITTETNTETTAGNNTESGSIGETESSSVSGSDTTTEPGGSGTTTEPGGDSTTDSGSESETETAPVGGGDKVESGKDAYYIIEAVAAYGRNGLANGWKYDNRFDLSNASGLDNNILFDFSDEKFYRLIRDFDPENDGQLKLEMIINAQANEEGIYVALCGANDEKLFYLTPKGGYWAFVGETELITPIAIVESAATTLYGIEMNIDLDNNTANVTINNKYCGEIKIPEGAIQRLIIGTNKVGKGTVGFSYVRLMKNYPVSDRFILGDIDVYEGKLPANWSIIGDFRLARINSMRLYDMYSVRAESKAGSESSAFKKFTKTSGVVSFETMILLPEKVDGASVSLISGGKKIITFETRDGKIYVGDEMVNDYIPNVWQTLHVDADTNTGKAKIYVNGKHKTTVDFEAKYFNEVRIDFAPDKDAVMWFDDVEVYEIIKHADYPAAPKVSESTDYNIGMNVCWLWRDQQSGEGWDAVSPFKEFDPYLGFYEEGLRETADWELKWMAEHGVDFVHVCWYCPSDNVQAPIKEMRHSYAALHDGYMMAEYSDLVDFCIMWENNAIDCYSFEQFRDYIWNYWCEYYFSDERYARLDNMAIISVWNRANLEVTFGGAEGARQAMAWMEEEIKKYGYDGIIFLAQTQGQVNAETYQKITDQGFDATYAYHWGARGEDEKYQVKCNKYNIEMSTGISHHIPTISIGFNDVGRNDTRDPIVSVSGHKKVCVQAKSQVDAFNTGTWRDNTIFLSTWNEYSEGTYMFPTESTGFDYLENVRQVFTNDKSSHKNIDVRPTPEQIDRITHLYPDNHSPIRWYQFETEYTGHPSYVVNVNGYDLSFRFNPEKLDDGDILVVGEAKGKGFYSMLRLFYEWDRFTDDGVLTLHTFDEKTLVFRVGSNKVTVNGVEQELGYTFTLRDGLPQFHLKKLCDLIGYKYTVEGNTVFVQAASDEEYEKLKDSVSDAWEFDIPGEGQGWKIQQGSGLVGGYGTIMVTPTGNDVALIHDVEFPAGKYNVLKVGVKYNAEVMKGTATLYFKTKDAPAYAADKVIYMKYDTTGKGEGDTVEIVFLLDSCAEYAGIITGVRFDPFTGMTPFEVDYIRFELDESYSLENKLTEVEDENQWYFEIDGDAEGWTPHNAYLKEVSGGTALFGSSNEDPYIINKVNFRANRYHVLIVEMKYQDYMYGQMPRLYFTTESSANWDDDKYVKGILRLPADVKEGDTVLAIFDLTKCESWAGTITQIRIDPVGVDGEFAIESIRFYQKQGMEMNGARPTKPVEAVITNPESLPEGITVQAAGANLSIVSDPTDSTQKVFKVECNNSSSANNVYTYLNVGMQFSAGETYIVTYKIMPLTDYAGNSFKDTIIGGNFRYGTTAANSFKDHTFDMATNKSSGSEWIEVTVTVGVPTNYSAGGADCFQIWGKFSPQSGYGISYLVKDISVTLKY